MRAAFLIIAIFTALAPAADAEAASLREPALLVFDVTGAPVRIMTDRGAVDSHLSGQIFVSTAKAKRGALRATAQIASGLIYFDSVATTHGETGLIAVVITPDGRGSASLRPTTEPGKSVLALEAGLQATLTYDLMDRLLGKTDEQDFSVSPEEQANGKLTFSGRFDESTGSLDGRLVLGLRLVRRRSGALRSAAVPEFALSVLNEPLALQDTNRLELCIRIKYEPTNAEKQWKDDVEKMIDGAIEIWKKCHIQLRMAVGDEECLLVTLHEKLQHGGGGFCENKGGGKRSTVDIGHNVVADCKNKTTYGQVLAHEVGHGLGLPQDKTAGHSLMSDCAPAATLTADQCKIARGRSLRKVGSAEDGTNVGSQFRGVRVRPSVEEMTFDFRNATRQDANDLHVEFDRNVWVKSQKPQTFKDIKGERTQSLDLYRGGTIKAGAVLQLTIQCVGSQAKCKSCFWTKGGQRIEGGCECPK
jgi:hypothetical protein